MAQNITIQGASYSDVPSVTLPKTGGGTALFTDVTPTTAVESDVASGKLFFKADGTQATGTASGGGISVVTTQDEHGGDIVTITAEVVSPWSPWGDGAELIYTYSISETKLSDTDYATWTPSTSAQTIKSSVDWGTISADLSQYEYVLKTVIDNSTSYQVGTTMKSATLRNIVESIQVIYRKPSNRTNLISGTDNYNYCTTLNSGSLIDYYNSSGNLTMGWTTGYGIYGSINAPAFSSTTSQTPTITIKTPTYSARCSNSYFSTESASAVDQTNSTIKGTVYVYRVRKGGTDMYNIFNDIVELYNS